MADFQAENRYFRILRLRDLGIAADFEVQRVRVGIREALGERPCMPAIVRLHTLTGEPLVTNLAQIAERRIELPAGVPTQMEVGFSDAVVPGGSTLVVEVYLPDQLPALLPDRLPARLPDRERPGDLVTSQAGSDAQGAGLHAATASGTEPVAVDTPPDVHLVMAVFGRER